MHTYVHYGKHHKRALQNFLKSKKNFCSFSRSSFFIGEEFLLILKRYYERGTGPKTLQHFSVGVRRKFFKEKDTIRPKKYISIPSLLIKYNLELTLTFMAVLRSLFVMGVGKFAHRICG